MKTLSELQEQYEGYEREQKAIYDRALEIVNGQERGFQGDEEKRFDELTSKAKELTAEIKSRQKLEDFENQRILANLRSQPKKTEEQKVSERFSLVDTLRSLADGKGLEGVSAEVHQEAVREARNLGLRTEGNFSMPSSMMNLDNRAQTAGTAATAGTLIPTNLGAVEAALNPVLVTQKAGAKMLNGLTGNLTIPIGNALATATWEGETDEAANTDPTIKKVDLTPQRLAAITTVSKQLLMQSSASVEQWIREMLSNSIGVAVDTAVISGNGANITGITAYSGVNDVTFAGAATKALLWQMVSAVENDYALVDNMTWVINPDIAAVLRALSVDAGSGKFVLEGNQLLGYNCIVSTLAPTNIDTDKNLILFGDWSKCVIANWGGVDIMVDPYTKAEFGNIRIIANTYWDSELIHASSFCKADDVTG